MAQTHFVAELQFPRL